MPEESQVNVAPAWQSMSSCCCALQDPEGGNAWQICSHPERSSLGHFAALSLAQTFAHASLLPLLLLDELQPAPSAKTTTSINAHLIMTPRFARSTTSAARDGPMHSIKVAACERTSLNDKRRRKGGT